MQDLGIRGTGATADGARIDKCEHWLLAIASDTGTAAWRALPYGELLRRRWRQRNSRIPVQTLATDLPNARGTRVVLVEFKPGLSAFQRLELARRAIERVAEAHPRELAVSTAGFTPAASALVCEALVAAAAAEVCALPTRKAAAPPGSRLQVLRLYGQPAGRDYARTLAEAAGNGLARQLSFLPPNELFPGSYRAKVEALATEHGWETEFLDEASLARRGAGAFLAVTQGSDTPDAGILRVSYRRAGRSRGPRLALVGKGICFDTGGVNLKSARHMLGMHEDMQGSAVALGTLLALSRLAVDFDIDCWLALAMNHIGPRAYKPNDVVCALDGTTIEIVHSDAEGRMVLADTLTLACRAKPALVIDYATLTGACIHALGKAYSGIFTNRESLHPLLIVAGQSSGERVWPFPQDEDYDRALDSPIADIRQCAVEGEADHILAARFLSRFVPREVPWLHLDLGSSNVKGGLAHIPTDTTGFGVRYSLNLLLEQRLLDHLEGSRNG